MSLVIELRRRNVFKVAISYLVLAWIVVQVTSVAVPALNLPHWVNTLVFYLGVIGFPFALFFAWAFELTAEGIKRSKEVDQDQSISHETGKKLNSITIAFLLIAVVYIFYDYKSDNSNNIANLSSQTTESMELTKVLDQSEQPLTLNSKPAVTKQAPLTKSVLPLAVLPFVNMSNDKEQEYFVDGLTEELLNSLTRIEGLKVMGRTSSFAYKNKNMDLRVIAKELDVDYLVEGSVRKSGDKIRITMQLIEAKTGSHILSKTFDRKLENVFELQEEISHQVAAALKLSLVHKEDRYNKALAKLDYIAVEQLVSARAQIKERTTKSIKKAFITLDALDEKYPNIAEIIGLSAYAAMMHSSFGEKVLTTVQIIEMAERALTLDDQNIDALFVLAVIYDDSPQTLKLARNIYTSLIRFYPGGAEHYQYMLSYYSQTKATCETLQVFVDSVPDGVFSTKQKNETDYMILHCLHPEKAMEQLSLLNDKSVADYSNRRTNWDDFLQDTLQRITDNPNQRYLTSYYELLLKAGAEQEAQNLASQIDKTQEGYWPIFFVLSAYNHHVEFETKPFDFLERLQIDFNNASYFEDMAALSKQAMFEEKQPRLKTFLSAVPEFSIGIETLNPSMGLMLLQYHAEQKRISKRTATALFEAIKNYKEDSSASYHYWGIAGYYLVSAFYSGNQAIAEEILNNNFKKGYQYWGENYDVTAFALRPWRKHPVVINYLARIEQDQIRVREKFNLK
ncbi:MAG: hypothetical protein MJK12_00700 [Colwellia sp.]|nr:hypothetical protein [Colwellia sp.]